MIQRYELELYDTEAGCDFHKSDNGDICKYEDAQKLEQENDQMKDIANNLLYWDTCPDDYKERIANIYGWQNELKEIKLKETGNES